MEKRAKAARFSLFDRFRHATFDYTEFIRCGAEFPCGGCWDMKIIERKHPIGPLQAHIPPISISPVRLDGV